MIKNALIAIYILVVLAISAAARAGVLPNNATQGDEASDFSAQKNELKTHVGTIEVMKDGSFILRINQQETLILQSQSDLSSYIGFKVMISGIELNRQNFPSCEIDSTDPLPRINSYDQNVFNFVVFGISEVIS